MKKLFLAGVVALMGATTVNAQGNFKVGAHVGLPVDDLAAAYAFNTGVDVAYTLNVSENFNLGVTTGYSHYFGETIIIELPGISNEELKTPDLGIIPIAATAQYLFTPKMYLGTDLGYTFFTGSGADGGAFYYQPKVGYKFGASEVYLGYKGMSKNGESLSSVNLGYAFTIGK